MVKILELITKVKGLGEEEQRGEGAPCLRLATLPCRSRHTLPPSQFPRPLFPGGWEGRCKKVHKRLKSDDSSISSQGKFVDLVGIHRMQLSSLVVSDE